jgi:hypothetical protein
VALLGKATFHHHTRGPLLAGCSCRGAGGAGAGHWRAAGDSGRVAGSHKIGKSGDDGPVTKTSNAAMNREPITGMRILRMAAK